MFPFVFLLLDIFHINFFSCLDALSRFKPARHKNLSLSVFDTPGAQLLHIKNDEKKNILEKWYQQFWKGMNQREGIKKSFCGCEKSQLMSPQCGRTDIWRTPHWARVASPYKLPANAHPCSALSSQVMQGSRREGLGGVGINRSVSKPCGTPALDGMPHLYLQLGPP